MTTPLERLRYHVTGAIERGEKTAIIEIPVVPRATSPYLNRPLRTLEDLLRDPTVSDRTVGRAFCEIEIRRNNNA